MQQPGVNIKHLSITELEQPHVQDALVTFPRSIVRGSKNSHSPNSYTSNLPQICASVFAIRWWHEKAVPVLTL